MIYTVTCSPSIDYVMYLPEFRVGAVSRAAREQMYPGGKGINVSIMLSHLGQESRALGFAAGFTGKALQDMLECEGCETDFIFLPRGDTRINVKLKGSQESDINAHGPDIPLRYIEMLMQKLSVLKAGDILVLAGNIPSTLPQGLYGNILENLQGRGILALVDATGDLLKNVLPHKPFLIKPNSHELGELFGAETETREQIIAYAHKAQALGARNVLVSRAGEGAILLAENGDILESAPPAGTVVNSVGAGDSMVAGFLAGWLATKQYDKAFALALAAGSATAFEEWLATREQVCKLIDHPETFGI